MFRRTRQDIFRTKGRLGVGRDLGSRLTRQRVATRPQDLERRRELVRRGLGHGLGFMGRALALAAFMLGSGLALVGGYVALAQGGVFVVREAEVLGTDNLSRLEILRAAGIGSRTSLLSLPVARVRAKVEAVPWVESASLERVWPHGVRIAVKERRPAILALVEGELYYLDPDLKPFTPVNPDATLDLPVLSGLVKADLLQPDDEMRSLLAGVKDLLANLPQEVVAAGGRLSEIHVDRVWGLSLVQSDLVPTVRLGVNDFAVRLRRLGPVVADLNRRGELKRALSIDLGEERRVVVRLGKEAA